MKQKVLAISGTTASHKSSLAIDMATKFQAEIISIDSVQVFKQATIGSAKVLPHQQQNIAHYLIDVLDSDASVNVQWFQTQARKAIKHISSLNKLPLCVGGTGFYLKAVLYDYHFKEETMTIAADHLSNQQLLEDLLKHDPKVAQKIHINNRQRLLRAYQRYHHHQKTQAQLTHNYDLQPLYDALIFYVTLPQETLIKNINLRVEQMFKQGLLQEVIALSDQGTNFNKQVLKAIGYHEFEAYFKNQATLDEVKEAIKVHTRQFAKRQKTWFKHQMEGIIIDASNPNDLKTMQERIDQWLYSNA